jgi:hypothetical protein
MKIPLIVVGSVVGGLIVGVGGALLEHGWGRAKLDLEYFTATRDAQRPEPPPPEGPQPVAEVDREEFDFGVMERDATRSHTFRITNRGDHPLDLRKGSTSCKCTITKFEDRSVEPGKTAEIVLEWTARTAGDAFREVATIFTNDPKRTRLDLTVTGRIIETLELEPREFLFGKMLVGQEKTVRVRLLSYRNESLAILEAKLGDSETSRFFDVVIEPIPADQWTDAGAKSGVLVALTVRPGLPIGPFREQLELKTNVGDRETLRVYVEGHVVSDISIVGRGWSEDLGVLSIGRVNGQEGTKRKLAVFIRGNDSDAIQFETVKKSPDFLQIHFGKRTVIQGGRVVKLPLIVEIPPGVGPVSRLGTQQGDLGEILIQTNHPRAQQLRLRVRFVVDG